MEFVGSLSMLWLYLTALLPVALLALVLLYQLAVRSLPRRVWKPSGKTILLVDDDAKICAVTGRKLQRYGFMVLAASDGETAVKIAKDYPHHIDLLITDVLMPGMSGPFLADYLLTLRPLTPVLFISGLAQEEGVPQTTRPGIEFLGKPFTTETLTHKVQQLLEEKCYAA
jgi:two-component system cell cycle sensor histidine kinase/response regulator CckA